MRRSGYGKEKREWTALQRPDDQEAQDTQGDHNYASMMEIGPRVGTGTRVDIATCAMLLRLVIMVLSVC